MNLAPSASDEAPRVASHGDPLLCSPSPHPTKDPAPGRAISILAEVSIPALCPWRYSVAVSAW
jgi:hypothetical protein